MVHWTVQEGEGGLSLDFIEDVTEEIQTHVPLKKQYDIQVLVISPSETIYACNIIL